MGLAEGDIRRLTVEMSQTRFSYPGNLEIDDLKYQPSFFDAT
jgi:hypothetical protein